MKPPGDIASVAARQLCCGCGACAWAAAGSITMVDAAGQGRRPLVAAAASAELLGRAMRVCPGVEQAHDDLGRIGFDHPLAPSWGPILEIWEGHATDPEVRFNASSGGATSALALYAIERLGMHGLLHIASRKDVPYLNETVMSTTREEILARAGSRYAPASPCDRLDLVADAASPCVFAGKPCDVQAATRAAKLDDRLASRLGLTIACFCAGTSTTEGTLEMLRVMGIGDPSSLRSLRYRGKGWPGRATAVIEKDGVLEERSLSYDESWGAILAKHKQWRCNLCPDRTGEFADISVGDPWYKKPPSGDPGRSLILVRTERGREILREAREARYLTIAPAEEWKLRASQRAFPGLRGAIWGRLLALRIAGVPVPRYRGFDFLGHWWRELSCIEKLRSIFGTLRRLRRRRLRERVRIEPLDHARGRGRETEATAGGLAKRR